MKDSGNDGDADRFERTARQISEGHERIEKELMQLKARWQYLFDDPDGARALLLLYKNGKGTKQDFETMIDRIIESRTKAKL